MTVSSTTAPIRPTPHIDILFLGSPGVGKATFLARLPSVVHPSVTRREALSQSKSQTCKEGGLSQFTSPSTTTLPPPLEADAQPPPYASTTSLASPPATFSALAPPLTGPLSFSVTLFKRPYSITIHPSTSPLFIDSFPVFPPPKLAIIAFAINDRTTLYNARHYWSTKLREHYPDEEGMRVLLVGLKRDLRTDRKEKRKDWSASNGKGSNDTVSARPVRVLGTEIGMGAREVSNFSSTVGSSRDSEWEYECVMPEEGLQAAREMGADRYAECSAGTGELMWEVVEDITRMAAKTTVEEGRESSGSCVVL